MPMRRETTSPLRSFAPIHVGRSLRIVAPGTPQHRHRRDLVLSRGAFGSGEHETTLSCLEVVETLAAAPTSRVLDLGCGTGILAIAALATGHELAVCVDLDPAAAALTLLNCRLNGMAGRVGIVTGELGALAERPYDVVLANIYSDVLFAVADGLTASARPGATLVLSGIPWQDNFDVRQRYRSLGCEVVANRFMDDYSTVVLRRTA